MEVELWMDSVREYLAKSNQTSNAISQSPGVRLWGLSSVVERETAQTIS
jgi:hypothetical protein